MSNLLDDSYRKVLEDVYDACYKPNELIVENDIALRYGISKATASEVLHRLCSQGHLTCYPRSGYMVRTLSPLETEQLKRLRMVVESLVIDVLCSEASEEKIQTLQDYIITGNDEGVHASKSNRSFHLAMARLTGDSYLISVLESILGSCSRVEQYVSKENYLKWQDCHKEIIELLLAKDAKKAKEKLAEDINQR